MARGVTIEPGWARALASEFTADYFCELADFVRSEYTSTQVFPHHQAVFRAFDLCPFGVVKVVILGQDPYHGAGQAHGLCFSVPAGVAVPPSLKNIFAELEEDVPRAAPRDGNLEHWAAQGVLLLNATLTVRAGRPGSHQGKGWERFTDAVISTLSRERAHLVFMLWGAYARAKKPLIDGSRHLVLEAAHPSPFSARQGFFGCRHFSKANDYLRTHGSEPIAW